MSCWCACSGDPAPAPATAAASEHGRVVNPDDAVATAASADLAAPQLAARLLSAEASDADRATAKVSALATVAAVLRAASTGTPAMQGRAPVVIKALGAPALPGLATALADHDPVQRRLAALCLLQLGPEIHTEGNAAAVLPALTAARNDPDLAVRAAAEHAYRLATGDTSALDASRAEHEAALRRAR